ncbi:MAG: DUF2891 domain-containing protein [Myxococcota bacterium]
MLATVERCAELALRGIDREFPNKLSLHLESADDVRRPRELHPVFYGCYDWHSAVHGHWLLARATRRFPEARFAERAREALRNHLTPDKLAVELAYLRKRPSFERPYGLAWLLTLEAELRRWRDREAKGWAEALRPLGRLAVERFQEWLPKLGHPVRCGTHAQTAFALTLVYRWARTVDHLDMRRLVREHAERFYREDRNYALHLEPSGEDFLSPSLATADLMRHFLTAKEFANWLSQVFPGILGGGSTQWLVPVECRDRSDGRLAHLDGLNLSRAWMLDAVANALPRRDLRIRSLRVAADVHRNAGIEAIHTDHYAGTHWLGTFAVYLLTREP